jgi:hypothetical protein
MRFIARFLFSFFLVYDSELSSESKSSSYYTCFVLLLFCDSWCSPYFYGGGVCDGCFLWGSRGLCWDACRLRFWLCSWIYYKGIVGDLKAYCWFMLMKFKNPSAYYIDTNSFFYCLTWLLVLLLEAPPRVMFYKFRCFEMSP